MWLEVPHYLAVVQLDDLVKTSKSNLYWSSYES